MTAQEAAERWGVSLRQVQRLAAEQRIPGAQAFGRAWMIPLGAEKPADLRR
ncbi:MAG: helix-turn-helix domain-containing protein, partial [Christensenellaceae bacterium]|nr:helix-turn-helix domain-containing protein [Christensenellaceae bacterium]